MIKPASFEHSLNYRPHYSNGCYNNSFMVTVLGNFIKGAANILLHFAITATFARMRTTS